MFVLTISEKNVTRIISRKCNSRILIDGVNETVKHEMKDKEVDILVCY